VARDLWHYFVASMVWQMGGVTRVTGMKSDSARSTILVVDDDPAILEYAGGVLEECGYAVLTALNAATALVMLRNNEPIDLLFTDLVMPGSPRATRPIQLLGEACSKSPTDHTSSPAPSPQHWPDNRRSDAG
jgi:hypothetical protein